MQGSTDIPTPAIDALARGGTRFTAGYVTASLCHPSRAGLLTGRYQQRFGNERNPTGKANLEATAALARGERTLADDLHAAGYATGLIGKWHLGGTPEVGPMRRGFDEFFGFLHEGHYYAPPPYRGMYSRFRPQEIPYDNDNPLRRGDDTVDEPEYLTDTLAREAVAFIDRHHERPFFLYVPFNAVHSPMQAPVEVVEQFKHLPPQRAVFAGMLTSLDHAIGQILQALQKHDLENDTLVFFLSDNGGPTAELTSSNAPLSGGKGTLLEGGIRVPFCLRWPGHVPAGRTENRPISSLDVVPTTLAAARVILPTGRSFDGVNLIPFLQDGHRDDPHEALFWRMNEKAAIREGRWKLVRTAAPDSNGWALFDLQTDVGEARDLASEQPQRVAALSARWEAWNATLPPAPRKTP